MKSQKLFFTLLAIFVLNFNGWAASPYAALSSNRLLSDHKTESTGNSKLFAKDELRIEQMKLFVSLTPEKYGELRGKKLNFIEKASFNLSKHRMKQMLKYYQYGDGPSTLSKISWLLKGLLFGPIALALGYIFLKDDDRELIKWIWFGFIGFAAIVVLVILSM